MNLCSNCISYLWNINIPTKSGDQSLDIEPSVVSECLISVVFMAPDFGASSHQNVKLTFRILFLVNFNLCWAEERRSEKWEVRSEKLFSVVDICEMRGMGWRDGGPCLPCWPTEWRQPGHCGRVATPGARPLLTSSMTNYELFISISHPVSQSVNQGVTLILLIRLPPVTEEYWVIKCS